MAGTIVANTINTDTGLFSTNNAYLGMAKAWVNFGYISSTVTINNSFNVSSITRSSTGIYIINFTTAMANANYALAGGVEGALFPQPINVYASGGVNTLPTLKTTTQCQVVCGSGSVSDFYSGSVLFLGS